MYLLLNCFYVFIYYFKTCLLLYPFYDLMIFIYNPKELKLSSRKQYKQAKGPQLGGVVLLSCEYDLYDL